MKAAIAYLEALCPNVAGSPKIVLNCSGRGDKDVLSVSKILHPNG
jgi:tryptophan synthase beta chain